MVTESLAGAYCQNYQFSEKKLPVAGVRISFVGLEIGARLMSVMGQKRTKTPTRIMSALPPKADVISGKTDIGNFMSVSPPKADVI
jgi:hypothetical protein